MLSRRATHRAGPYRGNRTHACLSRLEQLLDSDMIAALKWAVSRYLMLILMLTLRLRVWAGNEREVKVKGEVGKSPSVHMVVEVPVTPPTPAITPATYLADIHIHLNPFLHQQTPCLRCSKDAKHDPVYLLIRGAACSSEIILVPGISCIALSIPASCAGLPSHR
jgi:hypothetical protein